MRRLAQIDIAHFDRVCAPQAIQFKPTRPAWFDRAIMDVLEDVRSKALGDNIRISMFEFDETE